MIRFDRANDKLKKLEKATNERVDSFNLLAGQTCPFAKDCKSRAVEENGKIRIKDAPGCRFRCYAASLEVLFPSVYRAHKRNTKIVKLTKKQLISVLIKHLPKRAKYIRLHTSGDFFSQRYFDAWLAVARLFPEKIFYAYTKALPYWIKRLGNIPDNFILTASYGGKKDDLIDQYSLRYAVVVYSREEARQLDLPIEETEEIVSDPQQRDQNVAILIHGVQPSGSQAGKAVYKIRKEKQNVLSHT